MKCSQCAAENDADSRYCKKCGSELGPKATETNSAGKAKRGGFYRFCLGTTAIWTCFLLGSFLATGMTMVNHGISDPAVFGLGFGMGLIFFAGVWFFWLWRPGPVPPCNGPAQPKWRQPALPSLFSSGP